METEGTRKRPHDLSNKRHFRAHHLSQKIKERIPGGRVQSFLLAALPARHKDQSAEDRGEVYRRLKNV